MCYARKPSNFLKLWMAVDYSYPRELQPENEAG